MRSSTAVFVGLALLFLPMCGGTSADAPDSGRTGEGGTSDDGASPGPDAASDDGPSLGPDAAPNDGGGGGGVETLDVSFAFVGCNRLQKADWSQSSNPSSANVAELQQTFADVAALTTAPKFFFFNGDLVLGLDSDTTLLKGQLDAWAQAFASDPSGIANKTKLVPLVGNHEMLQKIAPPGGGSKVELQNSAADAIWTAWLASSGFDALAGNGPTKAAPNADALEDDQSKLTYSFDDGEVHYVVLNTDTWTSTTDAKTGSTQIGWIALHWLQADLAAAQAKASTKHIFVFGHKPIITPLPLASSDDTINTAFTSGLETLLVSTEKVRGYFCAHAHQWDARKLPGDGPHGVYQIIAGNGGSQLEATWSSGFYGFTVARVYSSGRVGITSYQRSVPSPYTGAAQPAVAQPEMTIAP